MTETLTQVGPYAVESEIGRGGMGVVYKAVDGQLDRTVAIKALPEDFADDADRLARLDHEAKTLASLNHPNVAGIYGVEELRGQRYLVLEYVAGETLEERLRRGPMGLHEALEICAQIAGGLEAAHQSGVIHRDLKPANVKITDDGLVKILDFGLARYDLTHSLSSSNSDDQTLALPSGPKTAAGTIVGTVHYMSPEQARGKRVDRRTDIWSLAVVLYECLTGVNPFARDSAGDSIAAVLTVEPDFEALPGPLPQMVRETLRRSLRKDARRRLRDAGDVRLMLEDAGDEGTRHDSAVAATVTISEGRLRVTDEMCRALDRDGFDATLLGWEMRWADNNRDSDVLVLWIPSIGGDHTTSAWRDLIAAAPHRMIIVCPLGLEPGVDNRPVVSLDNQFVLMRSLAAHLKKELRPRRTVIAGFSCGSIMALRCAAGDTSGELFDGVLAIDPDMQESDCFLTRLFAGLDASSPENVVHALHQLSGSCGTLHEWLVLHQHMIECVDKVKADISPLIRQGRDLSEPFEGVHTGVESPFVGFLRSAIERVRTVRCVFHDSAENRRMVGEIRMAHLDDQCLGTRFSDDTLMFIPATDHIGMMSNDRLLEYLDLIVEALRGGGSAMPNDSTIHTPGR
jgi:serine/threonine protein kinase